MSTAAREIQAANPIIGIDPLTKRTLAKHCWNSVHTWCTEADCECLCHSAEPTEDTEGVPI
jgi:hypothetical protein